LRNRQLPPARLALAARQAHNTPSQSETADMRQPATVLVLHRLIDALPDQALRPLLISLILDDAAMPMAATPSPSPRATRRRPGWQKGRKRGPRRKPPAAPPPKSAVTLVDARHDIAVHTKGLTPPRPAGTTAGARETPAGTSAPGGRRRPGWPKGKPRGKRKPASAAKTDPAVPDPKLALRRKRENEARKARRAAAATGREDGRQRPDAGNGKAGNGTHDPAAGARKEPAATPDPAATKRARHADVMRARRAREAARQTDGAANSTDKAADAAAVKLWERALELSPKAPWKVAAKRFHINEALALDSWRSRELPPGITSVEVERFIAPPAN
jgi:hypothetical protein